MSGRTPGSPRHPSSRHLRPSDQCLARKMVSPLSRGNFCPCLTGVLNKKILIFYVFPCSKKKGAFFDKTTPISRTRGNGGFRTPKPSLKFSGSGDSGRCLGLREASDAIAVRCVNSDAAFRTTFSRVWRFTLFAFASVILHGSSTHVLVQAWRRVVADSLHRKTKKNT